MAKNIMRLRSKSREIKGDRERQRRTYIKKEIKRYRKKYIKKYIKNQREKFPKIDFMKKLCYITNLHCTQNSLTHTQIYTYRDKSTHRDKFKHTKTLNCC